MGYSKKISSLISVKSKTTFSTPIFYKDKQSNINVVIES